MDKETLLAPKKLRIFLVDDMPVDLRLMEWSVLMGEADDFEIVGTALNGFDALAKIPTAAPQLLITDLDMPRMDGIELTQRVRHSFPNIRVLVTSSTREKEAADRALRAGAHEYCNKSSLVTALAKELRLLQGCRTKTLDSNAHDRMDPKWAEQLFGGLLFSSAAGLAIVDREFRYQFINPALAAMNGLPPREHINKTVRAVLGDFADSLEPKFQMVLSTGKSLQNIEMEASTLPSRAQPGKWIEDYFPIIDSSGDVTHIAIVVVEGSALESEDPQNKNASASLGALQHSSSDPMRMFRSWKEIARYASTSVRTAQRWERDFDLPVRRLRTQRGVTVMAFKNDMDRWLAAAAQLPGVVLSEDGPHPVIDSAMLWEARVGLHHSAEDTQILRSWKEIARYLAVSVRAAQRWEQELGLPVLRMGIKLGVAVVAFKCDLDEWLRSKGAYPNAATASQ